MKEIFEKRNENRVTRDRYKLNLNIPRINQVTFDTRSLKFYGPKIWNSLPVNIKTAENVNAFKVACVVDIKLFFYGLILL